MVPEEIKIIVFCRALGKSQELTILLKETFCKDCDACKACGICEPYHRGDK